MVRRALVYAVTAFAALVLSCVARCPHAAARPPVPDVRPLLVELDQLEGRFITHELTTARWRAAR